MDKENTHPTRIAKYSLAFLKMIKRKEKGFLSGQMEGCMKDLGKMVSNMDLDCIMKKMEQ